VRRWIIRGLWIGGIVAFFGGGYLANSLVQAPPQHVYTQHAAVHLHGYSSNGTLERPSQADIAQVVAALRTRAHAVLDGDRAAFLGVVDGSRRFQTAERDVWDNTRHLRFARLSYTYDGLVEPDTPLTTPSFLARVTTRYELKGFDTSPVEVDDGFTFVKQQGVWKLASVTDADGQLNAKTLPVPWDGAPITTYGDSDYLVIVDRGREDLARYLLTVCHQASAASGELLDSVNTRPTVVIATSHSRGFRRFSGPDAAAVTYKLTTSDDNPSGWRLVLNPEYVDGVAHDPVVLRHELTHLATQSYLQYLPEWLAEGSAEYVGWHASGGLATALRARGYTSVHALPARLPISANFYLQHVQLNYAQGMALVTWVAENRGSAAVRALMSAYADAAARSTSYDADLVTPHVLQSVLGMTPEALARAAYAEMNDAVRRS
jgi:hypothetical protein